MHFKHILFFFFFEKKCGKFHTMVCTFSEKKLKKMVKNGLIWLKMHFKHKLFKNKK